MGSTRDGWQERHKAAVPDELGHRWFVFDTRDGFRCCASCGKCEPRDKSKLKPCKGPARIVLRDGEP